MSFSSSSSSSENHRVLAYFSEPLIKPAVRHERVARTLPRPPNERQKTKWNDRKTSYVRILPPKYGNHLALDAINIIFVRCIRFSTSYCCTSTRRGRSRMNKTWNEYRDRRTALLVPHRSAADHRHVKR